MSIYLFRRVMLAIATVFIISFLVFSFIRLLPGDIVRQLLESSGYDPKREAELRRELGLDSPFTHQYVRWVSGVLHGYLGKSLWSGESVTDLIRRRLPVTVELTALALLTASVMGVSVGSIAAMTQDSWLDYAARSVSIFSISVPYFLVAMLTVSLPARLWGWTPPVYRYPLLENPIEHFMSMLLPGVVLGIYLAGAVARMTRSSLLEVLRLDYVRTARSKGLTERVILYRHAMKNAIIPVLTLQSLQFAFLLGGSVIVETVYGLPGIGRLLNDSLSVRDYTVVQGVTLTFSAILVITNLAVDVIYGVIDPRLRLG